MSDDRITCRRLRVPVAQPVLPSIRLSRTPYRPSWSTWQVVVLVLGVCLTGTSLSFCGLCVILPVGCELLDRLALRIMVGGPPVGPPFFGGF